MKTSTNEVAMLDTEPLTIAERSSVESKLARNGVVQLAPGRRIHRPSPDTDTGPGNLAAVLAEKRNGRPLQTDAEPDDPQLAPAPGLCTPEETAALKTAFEALAKIETEQREVDTMERDYRFSTDPKQRAQLPTLAERAEALKAEHAKVRGAVRVAVLAVLDAAVKRAAAEYTAAAHMVADAAGQYVGMASLRDELIGSRNFDPLGLWGMVGGLLAPDLAHRPRGWSLAIDAYGREMLWHGASPAHLDAVRTAQAKFRQELTPILAGAAWPFDR
jgi:hypothetical protein